MFSTRERRRAAMSFSAPTPKRAAVREGYVFRTWAPHARAISVVGEFNGWNAAAHPMELVEHEIWEGFVPGLKEYDLYKFAVTGADGECA